MELGWARIIRGFDACERGPRPRPALLGLLLGAVGEPMRDFRAFFKESNSHWADGTGVLLLMTEILHDVTSKTLPSPWNYGSIVYMGSCKIYIINSTSDIELEEPTTPFGACGLRLCLSWGAGSKWMAKGLDPKTEEHARASLSLSLSVSVSLSLSLCVCLCARMGVSLFV